MKFRDLSIRNNSQWTSYTNFIAATGTIMTVEVGMEYC